MRFCLSKINLRQEKEMESLVGAIVPEEKMEVEKEGGEAEADPEPMVKDVEVCGVCGDAAAKYKCPRCAKRTCSLKCVKAHKQADDCRCVSLFRLTDCIYMVSTRQDPAHMQPLGAGRNQPVVMVSFDHSAACLFPRSETPASWRLVARLPANLDGQLPRPRCGLAK